MAVDARESAELVDFLSAGVRMKEGIRGTGGGVEWSLGEEGDDARVLRDNVRWCGRGLMGWVKGSGSEFVRTAEEVASEERKRFGWR
jgi:hypothetical protein